MIPIQVEVAISFSRIFRLLPEDSYLLSSLRGNWLRPFAPTHSTANQAVGPDQQAIQRQTESLKFPSCCKLAIP
jgi:hypothetical protein